MKDDRTQKITLFSQPSRAKRKAGRLHIDWEEIFRKDLRKLELPGRM
jgi:hypothetical protein